MALLSVSGPRSDSDFDDGVLQHAKPFCRTDIASDSRRGAQRLPEQLGTWPERDSPEGQWRVLLTRIPWNQGSLAGDIPTFLSRSGRDLLRTHNAG